MHKNKKKLTLICYLMPWLMIDYFLILNIQSPVIKSLLHVLERKILGHIKHIQRVTPKYTFYPNISDELKCLGGN